MRDLTKSKSREEWYVAWKKEADHLYRAYQCIADPVIYDELDEAIRNIQAVFFEISIKMEKEGTWDKKE